mgnify:CR=1 FL=1
MSVEMWAMDLWRVWRAKTSRVRKNPHMGTGKKEGELELSDSKTRNWIWNILIQYRVSSHHGIGNSAKTIIVSEACLRYIYDGSP